MTLIGIDSMQWASFSEVTCVLLFGELNWMRVGMGMRQRRSKHALSARWKIDL